MLAFSWRCRGTSLKWCTQDFVGSESFHCGVGDIFMPLRHARTCSAFVWLLAIFTSSLVWIAIPPLKVSDQIVTLVFPLDK